MFGLRSLALSRCFDCVCRSGCCCCNVLGRIFACFIVSAVLPRLGHGPPTKVHFAGGTIHRPQYACTYVFNSLHRYLAAGKSKTRAAAKGWLRQRTGSGCFLLPPPHTHTHTHTRTIGTHKLTRESWTAARWRQFSSKYAWYVCYTFCYAFVLMSKSNRCCRAFATLFAMFKEVEKWEEKQEIGCGVGVTLKYNSKC